MRVRVYSAGDVSRDETEDEREEGGERRRTDSCPTPKRQSAREGCQSRAGRRRHSDGRTIIPPKMLVESNPIQRSETSKLS